MAEQIGSVKRGIAWGAIAFGVALAVIIGVRLEQAALAVVVGAACGVAASLPTGILVVSLLRRRDLSSEKRATRGYYGRPNQPPVVVVAPPTASQLPGPATWPGTYGAPAGTQREFAVIGEEGMEHGFDYWQAYE